MKIKGLQKSNDVQGVYPNAGAQEVINRFVSLGILELKDEKETYDRTYIYRKYVNIFMK